MGAQPCTLQRGSLLSKYRPNLGRDLLVGRKALELVDGAGVELRAGNHVDDFTDNLGTTLGVETYRPSASAGNSSGFVHEPTELSSLCLVTSARTRRTMYMFKLPTLKTEFETLSYSSSQPLKGMLYADSLWL